MVSLSKVSVRWKNAAPGRELLDNRCRTTTSSVLISRGECEKSIKALRKLNGRLVELTCRREEDENLLSRLTTRNQFS